jgi:hypothetical protein
MVQIKYEGISIEAGWRMVPMAEGERFELSTLITQGKRLAGVKTKRYAGELPPSL